MYLELFPDFASRAFKKQGFLGNGHDLTRLIKNLVLAEEESISPKLGYSSEADVAVVFSKDKDALKTLARLVKEIHDDKKKLKDAIAIHGK